MARIDVIVPCYRYAHFLRECVGSVLSQSLMDLRVLIIDDASPDDMADVAASLAAEDCRVEVLSHRVNRGHIATYNAGIDWATADYLLLLSADDVLLPGALARAVRLMDDNPEVGFTYGRVIYFPDGFPTHQLSDPDIALRDSPFQTSAAIIPPDRGRRARSRRVGAANRPKRGRSAPRTGARGEDEWEIFSGIEFIRSSRHSNQVHTATAIVRTALQKKIGEYRQELPHAGDMEMWLRFAVHAPVGYVNTYQGAAADEWHLTMVVLASARMVNQADAAAHSLCTKGQRQGEQKRVDTIKRIAPHDLCFHDLCLRAGILRATVRRLSRKFG
jgi:glycosyltransferase involved in cell wall biosynthesis